MKPIILMADIIDSSKHFPPKLAAEFRELVVSRNSQNAQGILSPLTITLGDEFQGVVGSVSDAISIIVSMEEDLIKSDYHYKIRYVVYEGEIATEINSKVAYGMVGAGLTKAREELNLLKKSKARFKFCLDDTPLQRAQNQLFKILQYFIDGWNAKDNYLISNFLGGLTYKEVAEKLNKDSSLMWRRRKNLAIDEYLACKSLILEAA